MNISTGRIPDPNRNKTTQELIGSLRVLIRGKSLNQALDSLDGRDLVFSIEAIKQELGSTNAQICKSLGW